MSLTHPAPTPRAHRTPRSRTTPTRRRGGHRTSSVIVAAALLTMWGVHALGWHFAVVLSMLAAAAAAALLIRHRPDIAVSITIVALTAAAPMAVLVADADNGRPLTEVMPLLMFAVSGPLPTLLAWTCRPVISRPVNAAIGSLILLTGAAAQWALGADAGVLHIALLTAATVIYLRYHRARRHHTQRFTTDDDGWTDLGGRALRDGLTAQLLIGHGRAIAVYRPAPGDLPAGQLQQVVAAAVPLARALRLPPSRVQPVVLHPQPGTQWQRELVNDGDTATYLPIGDSGALPGVRAAFTPRHHPAHLGPGASLKRAAYRWIDGRLVDRAAAVFPAVS